LCGGCAISPSIVLYTCEAVSMKELGAQKRKVAIIGCGGWGTALGMLLNGIGHEVTIWGVEPEYVEQMRRTRRNPRYLPGMDIPEGISLSSDLSHCVPQCEVVVAATPTMYLRSVCKRLAPHIKPHHLVVNVAKGIEEDTLLVGSQIVEDACGKGLKVAGLYGPSHAEEVARGLPTTVVATSREPQLARAVQDTFMCPTFRVYTNTDVIGVELGAALKNIIAIAAGICDGLGFGDNAKSALLTRGPHHHLHQPLRQEPGRGHAHRRRPDPGADTCRYGPGGRRHPHHAFRLHAGIPLRRGYAHNAGGVRGAVRRQGPPRGGQRPDAKGSPPRVRRVGGPPLKSAKAYRGRKTLTASPHSRMFCGSVDGP